MIGRPNRVALAFLLCLGVAGYCRGSELADALQAELKAMECPGALVAVATGSGEPQVFELGVADVKTQAPMRRNFRMRIGSVTKPFVGTAVLLLAQENKLSLDDAISKYVADVPQGERITLGQLANHTSGLFNSIANKDFQAAIRAEPQRQWQPHEILDYAFAKPAYSQPGEAWRYSNTNTVLLGEAISQVTGKPYTQVVKERVLVPLGLKETDFATDAALPQPSPSGYRNGRAGNWVGYGTVFYDVTPYSASWTGAARSLYSTVDDLLRATKPLVTGALLNDKSREALHAWAPTTGEGQQYGFCLVNRSGWLGHFGDVPGFSAVIGYLPEKAVTVVVLTNLSNTKHAH